MIMINSESETYSINVYITPAAQTGTLCVPKKTPNNTYYVQLFCDWFCS